MTTRRTAASQKSSLERDEKNETSDISPAVPNDVIFKLLGFSLAMIIIPISSYFLTLNTIFKGNTSFAGGMAALLANLVLISYIVVAMKEDQGEQSGQKTDSKKTQ